MKLHHLLAPAIAALALSAGRPAAAQTTTQTRVTHGTSMRGGVVTHRTRVVHVTKHKTRRAKRILGVKVGHKTVKTTTVRETTTSSNGATRTVVKRTH